MSYFFAIRHIKIQNANAVSGHTYGFPSPTQWLGAVHALQRRIQTEEHELLSDLQLSGCAIVAHDTQVHAHKLEGQYDQVFALTKNPLTRGTLFKDGKLKSPSMNEEGLMHCTVSLIIESASGSPDLIKAFKKYIPLMRIAGGNIFGLGDVEMLSVDEENYGFRKTMRSFLPGFVLCDRHDLMEDTLAQHAGMTSVDAWLDQIALKQHAVKVKDDQDQECIEWQNAHANRQGYIVPIQIGYKAISPCYEPSEVKRARDSETTFRFAEAIYSLAEWKSPLRMTTFSEMLWRYDHQDDLYLCRTQNTQKTCLVEDEFE